MDLIKCKACNKDISPNAKCCPHCGEPNKKEKKFTIPAFLKSKKMIIIYVILGIILVGGISIRIIFNREITCYKISRKLEKEYNYTCQNDNILEIIMYQAANKVGIGNGKRLIYCEKKKDNKEVDLYFNNDEERMAVYFFSDIGDGSYFHISSRNYYDEDTIKSSSDISDGSKEFPPYSQGNKQNIACFYSSGKKLKVGKKLEFDYDWANETFYNEDDYDDERKIKDYCDDELSEAIKLKKEFEKYFEGSGFKLGE